MKTQALAMAHYPRFYTVALGSVSGRFNLDSHMILENVPFCQRVGLDVSDRTRFHMG